MSQEWLFEKLQKKIQHYKRFDATGGMFDVADVEQVLTEAQKVPPLQGRVEELLEEHARLLQEREKHLNALRDARSRAEHTIQLLRDQNYLSARVMAERAEQMLGQAMTETGDPT